MNKEDIKKINDRIAFLQKEFDASNERIKALIICNNFILRVLGLSLKMMQSHAQVRKTDALKA